MGKKTLRQWSLAIAMPYEKLRYRWIRQGRIGEKTSKGYLLSEQDILLLLQEKQTVTDYCKKKGISRQTYYTRKKQEN